MEICRACLIYGHKLHNLEDYPVVVKGFSEIANIVIDEMNDNLPQHVCSECLQEFFNFEKFKMKILLSNRILVNSTPGDEPSDFDQENNQKPSDERVNYDLGSSQELDMESEGKIKEEISDIHVKEEFTDLPTAEVFDNNCATDGIAYKDCTFKENKKIKKKGKERKKAKVKITKKKGPVKSGNPRNIIRVDPEKITVIELTKEEQIRVQQDEGRKPSYLSMPFKCEKCFKGFNYERKLKAHDEKYHKPGGAYACDVCGRTMSTAPSLHVHLKKHRLVYQCNVCLCRFAEKWRAVSHYETSHEGVQVAMPCKHCDRVFSNRSTLTGHTRRHHPLTERPRCDVCGKTFLTRDSLLDHMLIHTGEKNYPCPVCGKKFRLRQTVAIHMLSHSTSRAFYCAACDVTFKCHSALSYHLRTADKHVTEQQRRCDRCGRTFSTGYRLRSHVMASHLGVKRQRRRRAADRDTRYVCDQCGRGFTARRTLENHQLIHSGARPHACPQCDATFTQRATQRTHTKRVHRAAT